MDKKELNFSAPLLSVRRISSPRNTPMKDYREIKKGFPHTKQHLSPTNKSDFKQDQDNVPGAVPFVWEHTPGRPKDHSEPLCAPEKNLSIIPKFPPGRVSKFIRPPVRKQTEDHHYVHTSRNEVFFNEGLPRWESSGVSLEGVSQSGKDDYSDALDALSAGESCSWSCNVSGLSSSDGPNTKPSDPQIQDFIMKRFLPAAKAMTLDTPQYASRKQLTRPESPMAVIKEIPGDELNVIPSYSAAFMEEVSCDEGDDSCNNIVKSCGLVPKFPFKNYLGLVSPVPGMKSTFPSPQSSLNRNNKNANQLAWNANHTEKSFDRSESFDPCGQLDYGHNLLGKTNSFPIKQSRGGCISPYRDQAPRSPFQGKGFLGLPKMVENSKHDRLLLPSEESSSSGKLPQHPKPNSSSDSGSPVVEKTLYIDSIKTVKTQHLNSSSSDAKKPICFADKNLKELEVISMEDSEFISCAAKESSVLSSSVPLPLGRSDIRTQCGSIIGQPFDRNSSLCNEQNFGSVFEENPMAISLPSPLPPPLPKSPSDSWLKRALPKIPFRKKAPVAATAAPVNKKWENIVKASKLHKDHLRYSEELVTGASQQPKP